MAKNEGRMAGKRRVVVLAALAAAVAVAVVGGLGAAPNNSDHAVAKACSVGCW